MPAEQCIFSYRNTSIPEMSLEFGSTISWIVTTFRDLLTEQPVLSFTGIESGKIGYEPSMSPAERFVHGRQVLTRAATSTSYLGEKTVWTKKTDSHYDICFVEVVIANGQETSSIKGYRRYQAIYIEHQSIITLELKILNKQLPDEESVQLQLSREELTGFTHILCAASWFDEEPVVGMAELNTFGGGIDSINTRRKLLMGMGRIAAGQFGRWVRQEMEVKNKPA
ncbi:uncharacterized protein BP5553_10489 [Venustampulla echinocandica]|uniref:Uncharacterized protein n=1 Tax=Venustampulla echinocandica TaxID=2656787 RepID=A0A370T9F6_9HELO|nr:uncharacterized protein BP5553_10489 [Venustampulla echinocandica]RDL30211.1 hypothetical protein BP5553_10489 [Venustampulla echinocandica]